MLLLEEKKVIKVSQLLQVIPITNVISKIIKVYFNKELLPLNSLKSSV